MSSPSRASYGRCMFWLTGRLKRFMLACLSGHSGRSLLLLQSASLVDLCSCMSSAKCTSSCADDGVPTTGSFMCKTAQAIHHIGQVTVQEKWPTLKRVMQMYLQSRNFCQMSLTLSPLNYNHFDCHWLLLTLFALNYPNNDFYVGKWSLCCRHGAVLHIHRFVLYHIACNVQCMYVWHAKVHVCYLVRLNLQLWQSC